MAAPFLTYGGGAYADVPQEVISGPQTYNVSVAETNAIGDPANVVRSTYGVARAEPNGTSDASTKFISTAAAFAESNATQTLEGKTLTLPVARAESNGTQTTEGSQLAGNVARAESNGTQTAEDRLLTKVVEIAESVSTAMAGVPLALGVHTAVAGSGQTTETSNTVNTTEGSCILIAVHWEGNISEPTITDSRGNTWTLVGVANQITAYPSYGAVYKNEGGTRGTEHTFSVSHSSWLSFWVQEITGSSPVVDAITPLAYNDSTNPRTANAYVNSVAEEILLCFVATTNGDQTFSWNNGFTSNGDDIIPGTSWTGSLASEPVSSIGSYTGSVDLSNDSGSAGLLTLGVKNGGASGSEFDATVVPSSTQWDVDQADTSGNQTTQDQTLAASGSMSESAGITDSGTGADQNTKPSSGARVRTDSHWSVTNLLRAIAFNEGSGATVMDAVSGTNYTSNADWTANGQLFTSANGDYVDLGAILSTINSGWTVFLSLKIPSGIVGQHLVATMSSISGTGMAISVNTESTAGKFYGRMFDGEAHAAGSLNIIPADTWTTIGSRFDGSTIENIVSGTLQGTPSSVVTLPVASSQNFRIGSRGTAYFDGEIAWVLVYDRALSETEILSITANPWQVFPAQASSPVATLSSTQSRAESNAIQTQETSANVSSAARAESNGIQTQESAQQASGVSFGETNGTQTSEGRTLSVIGVRSETNGIQTQESAQWNAQAAQSETNGTQTVEGKFITTPAGFNESNATQDLPAASWVTTAARAESNGTQTTEASTQASTQAASESNAIQESSTKELVINGASSDTTSTATQESSQNSTTAAGTDNNGTQTLESVLRAVPGVQSETNPIVDQPGASQASSQSTGDTQGSNTIQGAQGILGASLGESNQIQTVETVGAVFQSARSESNGTQTNEYNTSSTNSGASDVVNASTDESTKLLFSVSRSEPNSTYEESGAFTRTPASVGETNSTNTVEDRTLLVTRDTNESNATQDASGRTMATAVDRSETNGTSDSRNAQQASTVTRSDISSTTDLAEGSTGDFVDCEDIQGTSDSRSLHLSAQVAMAETNQIQDAQSVTWALQCQATNTAGIVDESTRIRLTLLATVDTNPVLDYTTSSNSMVAAISELNAIGSTCGGAIGIVAQVLDSMAGMADQDSSVISTINVSSVDTAVIISVETSNALRYTSVIEGMAAQDIATSLSILTAQRSETNATQDEYNYLSGPQSIDVFISEISHIFDTISATGVGLVVKPENIGRLDFAVAEKRKIFVKTEVVHVVTKVIKPLFYRR